MLFGINHQEIPGQKTLVYLAVSQEKPFLPDRPMLVWHARHARKEDNSRTAILKAKTNFYFCLFLLLFLNLEAILSSGNKH